MSLALATRGIISGFRAVGGAAIAVPVCEPEVTAEEYGEMRLTGKEYLEIQAARLEVIKELTPSIYGEDLRPSIKISIED